MSLDLKLIRNLNDSALISQLKFEVGEERKHLSHVLTYLREVERRKLFTLYGYSSLFTFVVKELGFSEGSAFRRISAMRLIRDLPEIEDKIADGSLNLSNATSAQKLFNTGAQNQKPRSVEEKLEVIAKLENKTAREGEKEIAKISPQAPVPTTEKTRPVSPKQVELKMIVTVEFIERMQTLKDRLSHKFPKLSHLELFQYLVDQELKKAEPRTSLRKNFGAREDYKRPSDQRYRQPDGGGNKQSGDRSCKQPNREYKESGDQDYKRPHIGESKSAGGEAPKRANSDEFKRASDEEFERASDGGFEWSHDLKGTQKTQSARDHFTSAQKFQTFDTNANQIAGEKSQRRNTADLSAARPSQSAQHSRYIPASLKRAIRRTYHDRCAYVSSINGKRCNETRFLDFDHIVPLALGGKSEESNLRLLCRAHNLAEAARVFGQRKINCYSKTGRELRA